MAQQKERPGEPPRHNVRRHPTSLPRPVIPPLPGEAERPRFPRADVPPVASRPQPPAFHIRPSGGSATPAAAARCRATKSGDPGRAAGPRMPAPAPLPEMREEKESRSRLVTIGEEVPRPSARRPDSVRLGPRGRPLRPGRSAWQRTRSGTPNTCVTWGFADLQRAILLKEILDPPVALRQDW